MRPAFVYLDLGNVVFTFDRGRAFRQMAAECGADAATVEAVVMAGGLQERLEQGRLDWAAFHAEFSRRTGTSSDPARLARAAADMFEVNPGIMPIVAGLERAGVPTGVLSNTCTVHWDHIVARGSWLIPGRFAPIVLSCAAGVMKPERRIYEAAADAAGVSPERIFFTDDTPGHVAAARGAGWDAEVFTTPAALIAALDQRGLRLGL
jgi:putative hydrolase of the HAD superfamily